MNDWTDLVGAVLGAGALLLMGWWLTVLFGSFV